MKYLTVLMLFVASTCFAGECVVNTDTGVVREWTSGVWHSKPPCAANEKVMPFKGNPSCPGDVVLKYKDGSITETADHYAKAKTIEDRVVALETEVSTVKADVATAKSDIEAIQKP